VRPQWPVGRGIELTNPANAAKAAAMMSADRGLDALAHPAIHSLNRGSGHDRSLRVAAERRERFGARFGPPVISLGLVFERFLKLLVYADCPLEHRVGLLALVANGLEHACSQRIELALNGGLGA
jgi:hypothetical protein